MKSRITAHLSARFKPLLPLCPHPPQALAQHQGGSKSQPSQGKLLTKGSLLPDVNQGNRNRDDTNQKEIP